MLTNIEIDFKNIELDMYGIGKYQLYFDMVTDNFSANYKYLSSHIFNMMINQKLVQKAVYGFQKGLEILYFFGSLWFGILFILTIPVWAPLYLMTASMCRSLNFMKRIIELPQQFFRPQITQPIRYAILKGNGKYLRNSGEQDAFLYQLYDYTLRKFLSIEEIDPITKIAEIQCETLAQWKFFKDNGVKNVKCLQSKPQILEKQKEICAGIQIKKQSYNIEEFSNEYDTIVALNIKQKLNKYLNRSQGDQKVDVLKILSYIKHHVSQNGYVIWGDFFQQDGQIKVLQELFSVYGLRIEESENIQKNISYAEKLLKYRTNKYWEEDLLQKVVLKAKQLLGLKRDYSKKFFVVFILSRGAKVNC